MKKTILIIFVLLLGIIQTVTPKDFYLNPLSKIQYNIPSGIDDGWYEATVKYSNYSTGTYETYSLNVQVEYNKVIKIAFGNGGSVHSGYNNEGYYYSGGNLYLETDYNGNTIAASTTVTISDTNGTRTFKIRIE